MDIKNTAVIISFPSSPIPFGQVSSLKGYTWSSISSFTHRAAQGPRLYGSGRDTWIARMGTFSPQCNNFWLKTDFFIAKEVAFLRETQLFHQNPQMPGKKRGRGHDRFVIPWKVVRMLMSPLEVPERCLWPNLHPPGSEGSLPAAFLVPCSLGHQPPGLQHEATRKSLGPARIPLDFSSASHHGPAATTVFGERLW